MHILLDVPRKPPPLSRPRVPKTPPDRKPRSAPPTYFLEAWRTHFGYSFRELAVSTGIDIGQLKRAEARAAGHDVKNKTKGVDTSIVHAYADAFGFSSIEPLQRRPEDPPSENELFAAAPAEWRSDIVRMISRLPKQ